MHVQYVKEVTLTTGNGYQAIYAFRGDGKKDFWAYDTKTGTWSKLHPTPRKVKQGGALVYLNGGAPDQVGHSRFYAGIHRMTLLATHFRTTRPRTWTAVGA